MTSTAPATNAAAWAFLCQCAIVAFWHHPGRQFDDLHIDSLAMDRELLRFAEDTQGCGELEWEQGGMPFDIGNGDRFLCAASQKPLHQERGFFQRDTAMTHNRTRFRDKGSSALGN